MSRWLSSARELETPELAPSRPPLVGRVVHDVLGIIGAGWVVWALFRVAQHLVHHHG
jgi:hypothetical protein